MGHWTLQAERLALVSLPAVLETIQRKSVAAVGLDGGRRGIGGGGRPGDVCCVLLPLVGQGAVPVAVTVNLAVWPIWTVVITRIGGDDRRDGRLDA